MRNGCIKPMRLEKIALLILVLRVSTDLAWGYFERSFTAVASMQLSSIFASLLIAGCILFLVFSFHQIGRIELVFQMLTLSLLVLSLIRTNDSSLFLDLLVLAVVSSIHPKKLCRVYAITVIACVLTIITAGLFGLVPMRDAMPNDRLVFAYGFIHPNALGGFLFSALGALTYSAWDTRHWRLLVITSSCASIFSFFTLSSNSSAVLLAFIAIINLLGHCTDMKKLKHVVNRRQGLILIAAPLAFALPMLFLTANHTTGGPFTSIADKLTHYRPLYANRYYASSGGFTLFGRQYINASSFHNGASFSAVDCSYSFMALVYGVIPLIALLFLYCLLIKRASRKPIHLFTIAAIIIYSAYGVVELLPIHLYSNFSLLLLATLTRNSRIDHSNRCIKTTT